MSGATEALDDYLARRGTDRPRPRCGTCAASRAAGSSRSSAPAPSGTSTPSRSTSRRCSRVRTSPPGRLHGPGVPGRPEAPAPGRRHGAVRAPGPRGRPGVDRPPDPRRAAGTAAAGHRRRARAVQARGPVRAPLPAALRDAGTGVGHEHAHPHRQAVPGAGGGPGRRRPPLPAAQPGGCRLDRPGPRRGAGAAAGADRGPREQPRPGAGALRAGRRASGIRRRRSTWSAGPLERSPSSTPAASTPAT